MRYLNLSRYETKYKDTQGRGADDASATPVAATDNASSVQSADCCEVCLIAPCAGVALRASSYAKTVHIATVDSGCPICRSP